MHRHLFALLILAIASPLSIAGDEGQKNAAPSAASPASTSRIVECRDENGRRELRQQTCPQGSTLVRELKMTGATSTTGAGSQNKSVEEQEIELRRRRIEREAKSAQEEQQKNVAQANCDDARRRLASLQRGTRVVLANETAPDGGPVFMDDQYRAAEIEKLKSRLQGCG